LREMHWGRSAVPACSQKLGAADAAYADGRWDSHRREAIRKVREALTALGAADPRPAQVETRYFGGHSE
jgi:hypothetical protein